MPNLRLVIPAPARRTHEPIVLTSSFGQRLATLNAVVRELREMGYRVIWSRLAGPLPQAHVHRDLAKSMTPLLDRMRNRTFKPAQGYTLISGEVDGVIVSWSEPQPH